MRSKPLSRLASIAAAAGLYCSAAEAHAAATEQGVGDGADLVIVGRVVSETSRPIPQPPGIILLASRWEYRLKVKRVIAGAYTGRTLIASGDADPALRSDRDLIFHLTSQPGGAFAVRSVERVR